MNSKIPLHFAHANGFPAGSYRKLFKHLDSSYQVFALEKFAHDPRYPLNNDWHNQAEELVDYIRMHTQQPVIAVGHSFGATISYIAACKYPQYFRSLIMLDPPLMTGLARYLFKWVKRTKLIDKVTPAGTTKYRNSQWHRSTDLHAYFASKALFRNIDHECIKDYIKAAIHTRDDRYELSFDKNIEAEVFRTIPSNITEFKGQLRIPAALLTGQFTNVCVPTLRRPFLKQNPNVQHLEISKGGHMFPLEQPIHVAQLINQLLGDWHH
ncbi:alpha/beta fold hydrolase [Agaribacter flavus]|uniref:Alpha/beta fold hydrolase n=1 Tax=Agaribacter flavus TaxID=1902781 RepID=A0ABV7FMT9_9ALTE